jgi:hypothetical protein
MKPSGFAAIALIGLFFAFAPTAIGGVPKILVLEHYGDCC